MMTSGFSFPVWRRAWYAEAVLSNRVVAASLKFDMIAWFRGQDV
jgi:hypothetical protein